MIAFFHQNPVDGEQGGVERYLATLAKYGSSRCLLVLGTEGETRIDGSTLHVQMRGPESLPRWMRFVAGLIKELALVRRTLKFHVVKVIEFSRPEFLVTAPLFAARKVVTMHGTGPDICDKQKYLVHHASTILAPLFADKVHVIGRDSSALRPWLRRLMAKRTSNIDAWCDDVFTATAPPPAPPFRVFYAGRLVTQKNPGLLAEVILAAKARYGSAIEFCYLGKDFDELNRRGCGGIVKDLGFKSAEELSAFLATCHAGILCSGFGEGSPFIIAEALSCGRAFVVPPLPTIEGTYRDAPGVIFAADWSVEAFLSALESAFELMSSASAHMSIHAHMLPQQASRAVPRLIDALERFAVK